MEEGGNKEHPEIGSSQIFMFLTLICSVCVRVLQIEEEATDKDNKNCSKDGMCGKVRLCLPLSTP